MRHPETESFSISYASGGRAAMASGLLQIRLACFELLLELLVVFETASERVVTGTLLP